MTIEKAREFAAQAWCRSTTAHKQMDPDLAESFAEILCAAVVEERERCIKAGWAEVCRLEEHGTWPTEEGFVAAIRVQP